MSASNKQKYDDRYDRHTFNSKNPLARFAHRSRYKVSLDLIQKTDNIRLLDFGCGDGRLLHHLTPKHHDSSFIGFEPYYKEQISEQISIFKDWDDILKDTQKNGLFDYVVCFEVLEHLNLENQTEIFNRVSQVLKKEGVFIVSVPIEKGLPSVVKNLRRLIIHYNGETYSFKNIVASLFGYKTKWMKNHREQSDYLSHIGFFFNELETHFKGKFRVIKRKFSPFTFLGYQLNSQVFYTLGLEKKSL